MLAHVPELADSAGDAVRAVAGSEVTAALVQAVNDVALGGAGEGDFEVVEVGSGGRVNEGGEDGVDVGLVYGAGSVFELRAAGVQEVKHVRNGGIYGKRRNKEETDKEIHKRRFHVLLHG